MAKTSLQLSKKNQEASMEAIKKFLSKNRTAYVLITCSPLSPEGDMQAEMFYEGEETLISYLVDHASQILEEEEGLCKNSLQSL